MRTLSQQELFVVSGGCVCVPDEEQYCPDPVDPTRRKGNNGFGNGGDDGVPGRSDFQDVTR